MKNTLLKILVLFLSVAALPFVSFAQNQATVPLFSADFGKGLEGISSYTPPPKAEKLEIVSDDAAPGGKALKVSLNPNVQSSGILKNLKVSQGKYNISVRAKGDCGLTLSVLGPSGTRYCANVKLSDSKWQTIETTYYAKRDFSFEISVIGYKTKPGEWFQLLELTVTPVADANLADLDIPAVYMEAEKYPGGKTTKIMEDKDASGGACTWGKQWYVLTRLPLPVTSKPLYVYMKLTTTENVKNKIELASECLSLQKLNIPVVNQWNWVKAGPVNYLEAGPLMDINPTGNTEAVTKLDAVILSTNPSLNPEEVKSQDNINGVVTAGRTAVPPVLDGDLSDACWKNAIKISPFILKGQNQFAKAGTSVWLSYDAENLYAAFHCEEPALDPLANVMHQFKKNISKNDDDKIFLDDFVMLLVAPENSKKHFFDMAFNAHGSVNDAKCSAPDFWESRNRNWNSGATVKTKTGNGFWTVEAAIPLKSFGKIPSAGDTWQIVLGRQRQSEKELSAWQPMMLGLHDPACFADLRFGDNVPGVQLLYMGPIQIGKNVFKADVPVPVGHDFLIEQYAQLPGSQLKRFSKQLAGSFSGETSAEYMIDAGGRFKLRFAYLDAATRSPYFLSPQYEIDVKTAFLTASLNSAAGEIQTYVNGDAYRPGNSLRNGINVIAVKASAGTSGELKVQNDVITLDNTWRFAENAEKGWDGAAFSDVAWQQAPFADGKLSKAGYLRKVIVMGESEIWPNWEKGGLSICKGAVQPVYFATRGIKGRTVKNYRFNIDVPEGFEVIGASGLNNTIKPVCTKTGEINRNGGKFTRYIVSLPNVSKYAADLAADHSAVEKYCAVLLKAPVQISDKTQEFYYFCTSDDGYVQEVARPLSVNLYPELKGRQPKKIVTQLWAELLKDETLRDAQLKDIAAMGFNQISNYSGYGVKKFVLMDFASWYIDCRVYLKDHPENALIDLKGNKKLALDEQGRYNFICTTVLLSDPAAKEFVEKAVIEYIKRTKASNICFDYEQRVLTSYLACFCPRCLDLFKKQFNIADANAGTIEKKYIKEWTAFMTQRLAQIAEMFRNAVHKAGTGTTLSVYSAYQSEEQKTYYGIDWSVMSGKIDFGSCGYERPVKELKDTLAALGSTPLVLGEIVYPYRQSERDYPGFCSKAALMQRMLDSTLGFLTYTYFSFDGRTFYAVAEVTRLIADYEDLFLNRKRVDADYEIKGIIPDNYAVLTDGQTTLIIMLNTDKTEKRFSIQTKALKPDARITDYYQAKDLGAPKVITGTIAPEDIKVFIIK